MVSTSPLAVPANSQLPSAEKQRQVMLRRTVPVVTFSQPTCKNRMGNDQSGLCATASTNVEYVGAWQWLRLLRGQDAILHCITRA
jgi:hypothetical protein